MVVLFNVTARSINILVILSSCQTSDLSETLPEDITCGGERKGGEQKTQQRLETASSGVFVVRFVDK